MNRSRNRSRRRSPNERHPHSAGRVAAIPTPRLIHDLTRPRHAASTLSRAAAPCKAGDTVLTSGGGTRRIVWIGTGRVLATRGRRDAATPGGPVVNAIWRRLLDRSGPRPGVVLTDDPDLHLMIGGKRIDAEVTTHDVLRRGGRGQAYIFRLPVERPRVRVVSRAGVPAELALARDPRSLGVGLQRIAVRQGTRFRLIRTADPALAKGFHTFEPHSRLRWTDGEADLPMALFNGFDGPIELVVSVGCTAQYPLFGEALSAAA